MLEEIKIKLEENKDNIIEILKEIETENVAFEEYNLSIEALSNNLKYTKLSANTISSYMPMNLPLYSLIIYTIIPRICAIQSNYRPSSKTITQSKKIHELLELDRYNINLFDGTRFSYLKNKVSKSDVVIFVGKPENANNLCQSLSSKTLFIYFGVGQNPVIIANNADLEIASKKIAETVMFNYGQDCAKPNIILCKKELHKQFVHNLIKEIEKNMYQKTTIKNLNSLKEIANLLVKEVEYIEYGGSVNFKERTLNPLIITKYLADDASNYNEFYGPVFRIMLYNNDVELKQYFSNPLYKQENMNISLFGNSNFVDELPASLVLHNEMVPEIDHGYHEYGGFGENTSYLLYRGVKIAKPILINREIEYFLNNPNFMLTNNKNNSTFSYNSKLNSILFEEYKNFVQNLFGNDINFSFIFGSYAKNMAKLTSDLDMLICLNKIDTELERKFREWYFMLHYMHGKIPDFYYPGELVTKDKLYSIIENNKNIEFRLKNDADTYDALFYTQIFTDKKKEIIGNNELLLKYESEFKKYVSTFCYQIFEILEKNNMIQNERDYMKCLMALSYNDLNFFGRRLEFDITDDKYAPIINKIDDGFLVKCLKKKK